MRIRRIGHARVCLSRRAINQPSNIHNLIDRDVESPRRIPGIINRRFGSVSDDSGRYRLEYHIEVEYPVTLEIVKTNCAVCGVKDCAISDTPPEHVASTHIRKREEGLIEIRVRDRIRTPRRTGIQVGYADVRAVARSTALVQDMPEDQERGQLGRVLSIEKPPAQVDRAGSGDAYHQS